MKKSEAGGKSCENTKRRSSFIRWQTVSSSECIPFFIWFKENKSLNLSNLSVSLTRINLIRMRTLSSIQISTMTKIYIDFLKGLTKSEIAFICHQKPQSILPWNRYLFLSKSVKIRSVKIWKEKAKYEGFLMTSIFSTSRVGIAILQEFRSKK